MCPQVRALLRQPEIGPPDGLGAHLLTHLLRLAVLVADSPVGDCVYDMYTFRAELARQTLRQLSHARPASSIRAVLGVGPQGSQRAREDQGALFRAIGGAEVLLAVVLEEEFEGFLGEGHGAADVGFEAVGEVLVGFLHEGLFGGMLDAVDGDGEFEVLEGGVRADGGEGAG